MERTDHILFFMRTISQSYVCGKTLRQSCYSASRVYKEMESRGLCYTKRGMGTFITEDSGMIKKLQSEMAEECLDSFLQGMKAIGIGLDEMIQLLRERYAKEDL